MIMGLSRFPAVMDAAVEAVLTTTEALRYVRDARGDLLWSSLDAVQDGLRRAKLTTYATFDEAEKQPQAAEAHMASLGGPATIAAYKAKAIAVEMAAANVSRSQILRDTLVNEARLILSPWCFRVAHHLHKLSNKINATVSRTGFTVAHGNQWVSWLVSRNYQSSPANACTPSAARIRRSAPLV